MNDNYILLDVFEFSAEAQIAKSKFEAEGIRTLFMDEKTIDSDPLISQAIGGVKLFVHKDDQVKAKKMYSEIRNYFTDENNNPIYCPNCATHKILIAPLQRKNLFYMLFPFFEKTRKKCTVCQTIF